MKVSVVTLGCKANQAESSTIASNLTSRGWRMVDLSESPDICIINTCSVTAKSDYQSRQYIRKACRSAARVLVTGCYSDLNRDRIASMDSRIRVFVNSEKLRLVEEITHRPVDETLIPEAGMRSRYFLKIQDGCDDSCSYCMIPKARGRSRSVPVEQLAAATEGISATYQEVVLTGIHIGTYGRDLSPKRTLAGLIQALLRTPIRRIRLSSLEIAEISDEILDVMGDDRICDHLHVPLQSGDDIILRMMKRRYDSQRFRAGIERLLSRIPDIALGSDVIVGFPGEGEEQYRRTESLLRDLPFAHFHVFPFSPRPGTAAAAMEGQIPPEIKKIRSSELIRLGREKKGFFLENQIGRILDPLIEERIGDGRYLGTAGNYLKVKVQVLQPCLGRIVNVRITGREGDSVVGVVVESN